MRVVTPIRQRPVGQPCFEPRSFHVAAVRGVTPQGVDYRHPASASSVEHPGTGGNGLLRPDDAQRRRRVDKTVLHVYDYKGAGTLPQVERLHNRLFFHGEPPACNAAKGCGFVWMPPHSIRFALERVQMRHYVWCVDDTAGSPAGQQTRRDPA